MEGTVGTDSGAQIRDGIKSVGKYRRLPAETNWTYDIAKFAVKPPPIAFRRRPAGESSCKYQKGARRC